MNKVADIRGPMGQKPEKQGKDPEWLAQVASLPCVICAEYGMQQLSPTQVHHCIHGRYSARRAPDRMTIPLCEGHHQGLLDTTKTALHQEPSKWKRLYGEDTTWISWTENKLTGG